jgi:hypothetical protein
MGCVRSQTDLRTVRCGKKGTKNQYKIPVDTANCPELTRWVECEGPPCPVNCEGSWSNWSAPKSDEPCGVQPYKERIFNITTQAAHGGYQCDYPHGDTERRNSGSPKVCCEQQGNWAMVGSCLADGTAKYTQTYKENKPGGCPSSAKAKFMPCCYQKNDWTDKTGCNSMGRKTQQQTTAGNCPDSVKTRQVNCSYVGPWVKIGGCGADGKQYYRRDVVNSGATATKSENCCFIGGWGGWTPSGDCDGSKRIHTRTRTVLNCPSGTRTTESQQRNCNDCEGKWVGGSVRNKFIRGSTVKIYDKMKTYTYKITKPASNGGKSCPHKDGEKKEEKVGKCRVGGKSIMITPRC